MQKEVCMFRIITLLCLLFAGCKSKNEQPPPKTFSGDGPILKTATVNCGLAPGVIPLAAPRIPVVAAEVGRMRKEIGVMCFEELWTQESKDAVIQALGPEMYTYYVDTRGENQRNGVNVCSPSQVKEVVACARKKCGQLPVEEETICAFEQCRDQLRNVFLFGGDKCLHCLVSSVGKSIDDVVDTCVRHSDGPAIVGASRAFDGQNGVVLASRWPLKNREVLRLRASFSNRVALFATIEPEGYEPIELACAHISTRSLLPPNHPDFSSWDEEMIAQINDVSSLLKTRAGSRPALFLADVNAGPEIGSKIDTEAPKVWRHILKLGFSSLAVDVNPPFCSVCEGNTLRPQSSDSNYLIDHVLLRDPAGGTELEPVSAYPFFNQPRQLVGYNGEPVESNLSDHYGVVVDFRLHKK